MKTRITLVSSSEYILNEDDTMSFKSHADNLDGLNKHIAFKTLQDGDNPIFIMLTAIATYEFFE
jgi:hypothetical protein